MHSDPFLPLMTFTMHFSISIAFASPEFVSFVFKLLLLLLPPRMEAHWSYRVLKNIFFLTLHPFCMATGSLRGRRAIKADWRMGGLPTPGWWRPRGDTFLGKRKEENNDSLHHIITAEVKTTVKTISKGDMEAGRVTTNWIRGWNVRKAERKDMYA